MSWSYDASNIATSTLFQVRYLVGDTDVNDQQVQDEEVNFALSVRPSIWGAASMVCQSLATQLSRQADVVDKDLRSTYSQRATAYARRAQTYDIQAAIRGGAMPYAGGISLADKSQQEQDSDRVLPQYTLGMDDNLIPIAPAGNETETEAGT